MTALNRIRYEMSKVQEFIARCLLMATTVLLSSSPANKIGLLMKSLTLAACLLAVSSPALAVVPEAAWKADPADTDKDYTVVPHANLKIQDAAYLGESKSASLIGTRGAPGSYR